MAQSVVLKGAQIKLYVGGTLYKEVQGIQYSIDYGEQEIYGIDSAFPQEIAPGRVSVQGTVQGLMITMSSGLQGYNLRAKINEILQGPYVSLAIQDRSSGANILWLPQMKVINEQISIQAKNTVKISFQFKGIIPYNPVDTN